jgi:hypothetical protein
MKRVLSPLSLANAGSQHIFCSEKDMHGNTQVRSVHLLLPVIFNVGQDMRRNLVSLRVNLALTSYLPHISNFNRLYLLVILTGKVKPFYLKMK